MQKWIVGIFLGLWLSNPATSAAQTDKQNAVLVDVQHLPGCAGLDCPPWPIPPDIIFCFQAGDTYFTGESRIVPWAMSTEKLAALKGKSVEIVVTKKTIQVTASGLTFHLRRTQNPTAVPSDTDLRPYGFSVGLAAYDLKYGLFYVSEHRVAVYFDQKLPTESPHSHSFQLMVLDLNGHVLAQRELQADPKAMDITPGPNDGILFGRAHELDLFDVNLQLVKSLPLSDSVAFIAFDRALNQLVEVTLDPASATQTAHFMDGDTLEERASLKYPIKGVAKFGEDQLIYTLGGNCVGSAHMMSDRHKWIALSDTPACAVLAFIGDDAIAYPFEHQLYILDSAGKQQAKMRIPAPDTFTRPVFVGLSDDRKQLAISALQKKTLSKNGVWPYYKEIFVYDLPSKRMTFRHALPAENYSAALSPDGSQIAVIEEGILRPIPIN